MFTALLLSHMDQADTYKIAQIERHAVFAGKLGDLVHEAIVVEKDGRRLTIQIRDDYHTRCLHPNQRLHEGDTVRLPAGISDGMSVDRDSVKR